MIVTLIAAAAENNALGKDNQMIWRLPDDFKRFKQLTTAHYIIMGRKTLESMDGPLPNRTNIVITRQKDYTHEVCIIVNSLDDALAACPQNEEVFIIGGGEIYKQSMEIADKIELTRVLGISPEADAYFPEINPAEWNLTESVFHGKDEKHNLEFVFETYLKKSRVAFDLIREKLFHEGIYGLVRHKEVEMLQWSCWEVWGHDVVLKGNDMAFFQGTMEANYSYIRIYRESYNFNYIIAHEDSLDPVYCNYITWHGESVICLYQDTANHQQYTLISITGATVVKLEIKILSDLTYLNENTFCYESEPGIIMQVQFPGLLEINKVPKDEFDATNYEILYTL